MGDTLSFGEVVETTEPADEGMTDRRIQVREKRVEVRRRRNIGDRTEEQAQFFVVDQEAEVVLYSGDTTTNSHHNPYSAAKARAYGFAHGYHMATDDHCPEPEGSTTPGAFDEGDMIHVENSVSVPDAEVETIKQHKGEPHYVLSWGDGNRNMKPVAEIDKKAVNAP